MATPKAVLSVVATTLLLQSLSLLPQPLALSQIAEQLAVAAPGKKVSTYRPPNRPLAKVRTDSTGTRGCETNRNVAQAFLLSPDNHFGETSLARPTLMWYVANARFASVTVVEQGVPAPLLEKTLPVPQNGVMQVEMPVGSPELKPGKDYRMTVTVHCSASRPSNSLAFAQAFISRITPSAELTRQLAGAKTPLERARIYAQQGVWYDAIAAYYQASLTNPDARDEMLAMLDQVQLSNVADFARKNLQATKTNP
jgi:hypothetical protein